MKLTEIEKLMIMIGSRSADALKRWEKADYLCDEVHAAYWLGKKNAYQEVLEDLEKITGKKEFDIWRKLKNEELQQERD